jgi:tripartite-type tricarboxylate transporter receptor subunit TctC
VTGLNRRELFARLGACLGAGAGAASGCRRAKVAGTCPELAGRRIRWIVPNAVGGGYDTESRLLQPFLEATLGVDVAIENIAGAGGRLGARAIADAPADGLTLGIAGMPGLLIASLLEEPGAIDPSRAFTILGRISRSAHVWAAGVDSPLRTMADVRAAAAQRPLVFAVNEVGSANVLSITVAAALLGVDATLVPGFEGMRGATFAAVRGDVDLVSFNYDTVRPLIAAGELRPLLQVSEEPIAAVAELEGVAVLGGPAGLAVEHARNTGQDEHYALRMSAALDRTVGSGRVVVAPAGLTPALTSCLSVALQLALASEELRDRTTRALDAADAETARADIEAAVADASLLRAIVERALDRIRG